MRVSSECVLDNVIDFRGSAIENMYRVRELTEGAFLHSFWHKISITKCLYLKICQLERRRSALSGAIFGTDENDL